MGGFFGVVSEKKCTLDLFYGVDYHSHLGTQHGGMAVFQDGRFCHTIHDIKNSPFRTKFRLYDRCTLLPTSQVVGRR